ncbi:hypothetical protein ATANTOWER_012897 [Ataeniobius toweri]|uniref:Uncharacterized protein n=1 Tax=Ataeniobius toweri TaxID=208326 RepID=A0ABU7B820_9TELE|nr:hypothetical protein [Ataeniobius toweri]
MVMDDSYSLQDLMNIPVETVQSHCSIFAVKVWEVTANVKMTFCECDAGTAMSVCGDRCNPGLSSGYILLHLGWAIVDNHEIDGGKNRKMKLCCHTQGCYPELRVMRKT